MNIYQLFRPRSILDFTMGWGGRYIGACALNIPHYIGIDMNHELKGAYKEMKEFTRSCGSTTQSKFIFKNALMVDYSQYEYDCVLTSPPYYNIETYRGMKTWTTKEAWNREFYVPLFTKTMRFLSKGGWYCLNISEEIYEVCIPLWGKATKKIPLTISTREKSKKNRYKEYIYCWNKF